MRIGINLLYLLPGIVGGTETYAAGLLQGLARVNSTDQIIVFVNQDAAEWPLPPVDNIKRVVCPIVGRKRNQRYFFEQTTFPLYLRRYHIDLLHSLGYIGPVISPCPTIVTIHDTNNYVAVAKGMPMYRRFVLPFITRLVAQTANQIITVSEFSKAEILHRMKLSASKISVIYEASNLGITSESAETWSELKNKYHIQEPYIMAFGGTTIHKNILRLIQSFNAIKNKFPYHLVLIGHLPPNVDLDNFLSEQSLTARIISTGYVPSNHISPLLSHADLFVLPSLYEGFGLPVLEAQEAGVAVACSTAGALPEVAGEGARFFDPNSVASISEALIDCLANVALREELKHKGNENLKRFSWEKAALETLAVYRQVLYK